MKTHTTPIRVRYKETDAMGVAHHANYAVWLEQARTEMMREYGLPYTALERRGLMFMLSRLEVNYRRAARFDDLILVECRVAEMRSRRARFEYTLTLENGTLLSTCVTEHFCADRTLRIVSFPPDVLERFG